MMQTFSHFFHFILYHIPQLASVFPPKKMLTGMTTMMCVVSLYIVLQRKYFPSIQNIIQTQS